jgi:hypothetical protein
MTARQSEKRNARQLGKGLEVATVSRRQLEPAGGSLAGVKDGTAKFRFGKGLSATSPPTKKINGPGENHVIMSSKLTMSAPGGRRHLPSKDRAAFAPECVGNTKTGR